MPILPAEPDIFPEELLEGEVSGGAASHQWWALYTMPRREKELMRRLRHLGINHYGPMLKRRLRSPGGRVRESRVPLFGSYVFLFGDEMARYRAMTTNCVARCLEVDDAAQLVHDLRQVRRLIQSDVPLTPEAKIQPGARVRVRTGALAGMEGVVVRRRGAACLLVAVQFLQQGALIQIDDFEVEPIEE
jgi:transcription antitermination factor NusG